jgi:hypothetical protein
LTYYQNKARKENQQAMVAEKKRMEPRGQSRGLSKEKWLEYRNKKTRRLSGLCQSHICLIPWQKQNKRSGRKNLQHMAVMVSSSRDFVYLFDVG